MLGKGLISLLVLKLELLGLCTTLTYATYLLGTHTPVYTFPLSSFLLLPLFLPSHQVHASLHCFAFAFFFMLPPHDQG